MKYLAVVSFLTIFGLTLSAPSYHHGDHHHGHHHHHAGSYAVVTKHDSSKQHGWEKKEWSPHGEEHHSYDLVAVDDHGHEGDWHKHEDYDAHAKYEFDYGVKDLKTGDIKNQWEHRDGDHVKGSYSLKEADGTTRIVDYRADDHSGFNAIVKKIGHAEHPTVEHKDIHYSGWEADSAHKGHLSHDYDYGHSYDHGHEHGYDDGHHHGHPTSYIKVEQH